MATQYRHYLVIFMPEGKDTVNHMRVIDAWSSTADLDSQYETTLRRYMVENEGGRYSGLGEGRFHVCEQSDHHWQLSASVRTEIADRQSLGKSAAVRILGEPDDHVGAFLAAL